MKKEGEEECACPLIMEEAMRHTPSESMLGISKITHELPGVPRP